MREFTAIFETKEGERRELGIEALNLEDALRIANDYASRHPELTFKEIGEDFL